MNYWLYTISDKNDFYFLTRNGEKKTATVKEYLDLITEKEFPEIIDWHVKQLLEKISVGDKIVIYGAENFLMGYGTVIGVNLKKKQASFNLSYGLTYAITSKGIKREVFSK